MITMKNLSLSNSLKCFIAVLLFNCFQLICLAQDSGTTSTTVKTTTTEHREWYTIPWVWVVGGIIVIALLVALLSSGRRSSQTTITDTGAGTRTITTDSDWSFIFQSLIFLFAKRFQTFLLACILFLQNPNLRKTQGNENNFSGGYYSCTI